MDHDAALGPAYMVCPASALDYHVRYPPVMLTTIVARPGICCNPQRVIIPTDAAFSALACSRTLHQPNAFWLAHKSAAFT